MRTNTFNTLTIFGICALGSVAIAFACHSLLTLPPIKGEEFMSIYLHQGLLKWPCLIVLFALAASAGFFTKVKKRWIVFGFIAPFGMAVIYEIARFKQSHNLIPFEIVMFWGPVGIIAALGCVGGRMFARRLHRPSPLPES